MKYLSLNTIVDAFCDNSTKTKSKFWGILAILTAINDDIKPNISYQFSANKLSLFLENIFCFNDKKTTFSDNTIWHVMFSKRWIPKIVDQMLSGTPNIYNVAAWYLRNESFPDNTSSSEVLSIFSKRLGLSLDNLSQLFSSENIDLTFDDSKYSDNDLLKELSKKFNNPSNYNSITAEGRFIVSNPGELSRAPFIQTLYAGQQTTECLLLTQFPLSDYYPIGSDNANEKVAERIVKRHLKDSYTEDELISILQKYNTELGSYGIHLFAFKYADSLTNINLKSFVQKANLAASYQVELQKLRKLSSIVKEGNYGICFFEDYIKSTSSLSKLTNIENTKIGDINLLTAMRAKPFLLLAGISGTGKSRIVKQMAYQSCPKGELREDTTSPGNYLLIEVKPNWHDSTELIGYESEINGRHYMVTPFIKFLAKAMCYDNVPFFVCMDEMNLAPVEQYFAEFLSVLESRKLISTGITSEALISADIFKKYGDQLKKELFGEQRTGESVSYQGNTEDPVVLFGKQQEVFEKLTNEGLRLPSNLIVIGTVNMDETTHQFSRKVIDRAMTIEMNIPDGTQPFSDFFDKSSPMAFYDSPISAEKFLPKYVQATEALNGSEDYDYLHKNVPILLNELNASLSGTPFKVAYRVQNELLLYFFSLRQEDTDTQATKLLDKAIDDIMMMKVLPRIEGDELMLEIPLNRLETFAINHNLDNAKSKILEMKSRLKNSQFASFWP